MKPLRLSIIIVNWNTAEMLAACLAAVQREVVAFGADDVETIVVDNASSDDSVARVRRDFPWVRLVGNATNMGFAAANNQAIRLSRGAAILLLNPDTVLHAGSLTTLLAFLDNHAEAGAVGPRLLNGDGTHQVAVQPMMTPARELWRLMLLDRVWPVASYSRRRQQMSTPHAVEVIKGACLMVRRAALEQVGLLDETYFMYTEEVDLCYRLRQAGWTLWHVPEAVVTHFGEGSSRQVREEMYLALYRSKVQFFRKVGGESLARRFKWYVQVAYLPRIWLGTVLGLGAASWRRRTDTWRRLLADLAAM